MGQIGHRETVRQRSRRSDAARARPPLRRCTSCLGRRPAAPARLRRRAVRVVFTPSSAESEAVSGAGAPKAGAPAVEAASPERPCPTGPGGHRVSAAARAVRPGAAFHGDARDQRGGRPDGGRQAYVASERTRSQDAERADPERRPHRPSSGWAAARHPRRVTCGAGRRCTLGLRERPRHPERDECAFGGSRSAAAPERRSAWSRRRSRNRPVP
jgi:hypothetical protein